MEVSSDLTSTSTSTSRKNMDSPGNHRSNGPLATPPDPAGPKRHMACDECRQRKLKCSGELTGCQRCVKQSLACHYSLQKQMGRPPKKRLRKNDDVPSRSDLVGIVESPLTLPRGATPARDSYEDNNRLQPEPLATASLPPMWPTFSATSPVPSMSSIIDPGLPEALSAPVVPLGIPQCACLSQMYICLNNLSVFNSPPFTSLTLHSLYATARTALGALHCEICPQVFSTNLQNVMFLSSSLIILGELWLRISHTDAVELGKAVASPLVEAMAAHNPQGERAFWEHWLHQIVRHGVIGGLVDPNDICAILFPLDGREPAPDLLSLVLGMEARQTQWHADLSRRQHCFWGKLPPPSEPTRLDGPPTDHRNNANGCNGDENDGCQLYASCSGPGGYPNSVPSANANPNPDQGGGSPIHSHVSLYEGEMICLKFIDRAKAFIRKFGFASHEYPDGIAL